MLLVRESSPIPKAGTWYLNRSKKHVSRQARAILSATHFEHDLNSASQGRGPVAATFVHFGFGNAAKDIVLGPQRPNCTKKYCSLFHLRAYFWPSRRREQLREATLET